MIEVLPGITTTMHRRGEWREAISQAPQIKPGYYTVLSEPNRVAEACRLLDDDPRLAACFRD